MLGFRSSKMGTEEACSRPPTWEDEFGAVNRLPEMTLMGKRAVFLLDLFLNFLFIQDVFLPSLKVKNTLGCLLYLRLYKANLLLPDFLKKGLSSGLLLGEVCSKESQLAFSLMSCSSQPCICSFSQHLLQSWQLQSSAYSSRTACRLKCYRLRVVVLGISTSRLAFLPHAFHLLHSPVSKPRRFFMDTSWALEQAGLHISK